MVVMFLLCDEKSLMLLLLVVEPVGRTHVRWPLRLLLEPAGHLVLQIGLGAHALRERDVRRAEPVPVEQLAQRPKALELGRSVDPVARPVAGRLDEADALEVPQHPRRPTGRLSGLVNREPLLHAAAQPYHSCVKVSAGGPRP